MALQDLVNQNANTINSTRQAIDNNKITASTHASNAIENTTKSIVDISNTLFTTFVNDETSKNIDAFSQIDEENMRNGVYYHVDNDLQKGFVANEEEARKNRENARKSYSDSITNDVYRHFFDKASANYISQTQSTFNSNTANYLMNQWGKQLETITSGYRTGDYTVDDINILNTAIGYGYEGLQDAFTDLVQNGWLSDEEISIITNNDKESTEYLATLAMLDVKLQFKGGKDSGINYSAFNNSIDQEGFKKDVIINRASTLASQDEETKIDWLTFNASTYAEDEKRKALEELEMNRGNSPNYTLNIEGKTIVLTDTDAQQYAESVANKKAKKAEEQLIFQTQELTRFETMGNTLQTIVNDPSYISSDEELATLLKANGYNGDVNFYLANYGSSLLPIMADNKEIKDLAVDVQNIFDTTVDSKERETSFKKIANSKYATNFNAYGFDITTWEGIEGNLNSDQWNYFKSAVGDEPKLSDYKTSTEYKQALEEYNKKAENVVTDIVRKNNNLTYYSWNAKQEKQQETEKELKEKESDELTKYIADNPNLVDKLYDNRINSYDSAVSFFESEGFNNDQAKVLASNQTTANAIALSKEEEEFSKATYSFSKILKKESDEETFNKLKSSEVGINLGLNQYDSYESFVENYDVPDVLANALADDSDLSKAYVTFIRGNTTTNQARLKSQEETKLEQKKIEQQNTNRNVFYQTNLLDMQEDITSKGFTSVDEVRDYITTTYPEINDSDKYGEDYLDTLSLQFQSQINSNKIDNKIVKDLYEVFMSPSLNNVSKETLEELQDYEMLGVTGIVDINNTSDEDFKSSTTYEFFVDVLDKVHRANPGLSTEETANKAIIQLIKDKDNKNLESLFLEGRLNKDFINADKVITSLNSALNSSGNFNEILYLATDGLNDFEKGRAVTTVTQLLSDFNPNYITMLTNDEVIALYQAEYAVANKSSIADDVVSEAEKLLQRYIADGKYKENTVGYNFGYLLSNGKTDQAKYYYLESLNSSLASLKSEGMADIDAISRVLEVYNIPFSEEEKNEIISDINEMPQEYRGIALDTVLTEFIPEKLDSNFTTISSIWKNQFNAYNKEYGYITAISNTGTMNEYIKDNVEYATAGQEETLWESLITKGNFKDGITKDLTYGTSTIPTVVYNERDIDGSYYNVIKETMLTFTNSEDRFSYLERNKAQLTKDAYKELSNMPSVNVIVSQKEKLKDINLLDYATKQLINIASTQNYGLGITENESSDFVTQFLNSHISEVQNLANKTDDPKYTKENFLSDITNFVRSGYIMQKSPQENIATPELYEGFRGDNCDYGVYLTKVNKNKELVNIPGTKTAIAKDFDKMGNDSSITTKSTFEYLNARNAITGSYIAERDTYMNMLNEVWLKDMNSTERSFAQQAIMMTNVLLANGYATVDFTAEDLKDDSKKVWVNVLTEFRKVGLSEGNSGELFFAFLKTNNEQNIKNIVEENLSRSIDGSIVSPEVEILPNGTINIISSVVDKDGYTTETTIEGYYTDGRMGLNINDNIIPIEQFNQSLKNKQLAKYIFTPDEYDNAYTGFLSDDVFLFNYSDNSINEVKNYNITMSDFNFSYPSMSDYVCVVRENTTNPAFEGRNYYDFEKVSGETLVKMYKTALENNDQHNVFIIESCLPNNWKNWLIAQ